MELAISYGVVFHASPSITLPSRNVTLIGVFSLAGEGNKAPEWVFAIKKTYNTTITHILKTFLPSSLASCSAFSLSNNMSLSAMKAGGGFNCWIKHLIGKECQ